MKYLVTGCAGFIGLNYVNYLLSNYSKCNVIGVDCLTYAANSNALETLQQSESFSFYKINICDSQSIDKLFFTERPDIVINFAAESHVDRSIQDASVFLKTNVLGVQVLLDASLRYGVKRFHQVSTDEVYGDVSLSSTQKCTESALLKPSSPYSASKASADLLALSYMRTHGVPVSISRSTNNYGRYQHIEKLIPTVIDRCIRNEYIPIYGDGTSVRDWIYVEDHCRAIDTIIRKGKCEIYNIGADNQWPNIRLAQKIVNMIDGCSSKILFVPERKGADVKYAVDCSKIRALNWNPTANFDDALGRTIRWYKSYLEKNII